MNFIRAFYITGATTVFVTLIGFLNNIILTRYLGPEGRGQYSIIINLMTFLYLLLGEGIRRTNTILIGNDKNQIKYILLLSSKYFLLVTTFFVIAFYFNSFWYELVPNISIELILVALLSAAITIFWRSIQSIYLGLKAINEYNLMQVFYTGSIFVVNLLIIYWLELDLNAIVWNLVIVSSAIVLVGVWSLYKIADSKNDKNTNTPKSISIAVKATIASITMFIFLKGDLFLVNYYLDASITGIYSISLVFVDLLQKLPLVLGPLVLTKSANREFSQNLNEFSKLFRVLLMTNIVLVLFLFLVGYYIIVFLFSQEFSASYYLLLYILPSLILFGSGHMIHAYFMGQGYPSGVLIINGIAAVFNFAMNIIFTPVYGIEAAAIICSVTYFVWSVSFSFYLIMKTQLTLKDLFYFRNDDLQYLFYSVKKTFKKNDE